LQDSFGLFAGTSRRKTSPRIAVSFVNNALCDDALSSPCASFAINIENTDYGEAYYAMNAGYRSLRKIARVVNTKEEAFELIEQAFGSIDLFFVLLENQRIALRNYALSLAEKGGVSWLEGSFLLAVCALAKEWGRRFRLEYHETAHENSVMMNGYDN
jgi:hypothetical protein